MALDRWPTASSPTAGDRSPPIALAEPAIAAPHHLSPAKRALVAIETLVSVCGLAGGLYMATHATTAMPVRYLDATWFTTWRWPGVALFFFVGVCPALVVGATLLRMRVAALSASIIW